VDKLKKENTELKEENSDLKERMESLESEKERLKKENAELLEKLAAAEAPVPAVRVIYFFVSPVALRYRNKVPAPFRHPRVIFF
jgi:cell shape-determining protein MreC